MPKQSFKKFVLAAHKSGVFGDTPEGDFVEDCGRDSTFKDFNHVEDLVGYLGFKRACSDAVKAAKKVFKKWENSDKREKKKKEKVDGLGPRELMQYSKACRLVWSRSHSRRMVVTRCTGEGGYLYCELCLDRTPRLHVDHIEPVGSLLSEGFLKRLACPSTALQGLCLECHRHKTKADMQKIRAKESK